MSWRVPEKAVVAFKDESSLRPLKYVWERKELRPGDSVLFCHVIPERTGIMWGVGGSGDSSRRVEITLSELVLFWNRRGLTAESRVLPRGDVAANLVNLARDIGATKLIMGYNGKQPPQKPRQGSLSRKVIDGVKSAPGQMLCTIVIATDTVEAYRHIAGAPSLNGTSTPGSSHHGDNSGPISGPLTPGTRNAPDQSPSPEFHDVSSNGDSVDVVLTTERILSAEVWPAAWNETIKNKLRNLELQHDEDLRMARRSNEALIERLQLELDLRQREQNAKEECTKLEQEIERKQESLLSVDSARRMAEKRAREAERQLELARDALEESEVKVTSLTAELDCCEKKKESLDLELNEVGRQLQELAQALAEAVKGREILAQQLTKEQKLLADAKVEAEVLRGREETARAQRAEQEAALRRTQAMQLQFREYLYLDLQAATGNFDERLKLGEGGFGPVYEGTIRRQKVAIKKLHPDSQQGVEELRKEIEVLGRNPHQHIVMLYGACSTHQCLVYEYMEHGNLEDRIRDDWKWGPLNWEKRISILYQVAQGLYFLHSANPPIIHRDLKPANILLDANDTAKIGDVGLAKIAYELQSSGRSLRTFMKDSGRVAGSWHYIDPEYSELGNFGPRSDVYALGIIMLQMLTGKGPQPSIGAFDDRGEINSVSLRGKLDKRAGMWGCEIVKELLKLAWECRRYHRRDRPDLRSVLEKLEELTNNAKELVQQRSQSFNGQLDYSIRESLLCPISWELMRDPHVAADGHTYEKEVIEMWLRNNDTSPMTNLQMEKTLIPNYQCRSQIREILDRETKRANRASSYHSGGQGGNRFYSASSSRV